MISLPIWIFILMLIFSVPIVLTFAVTFIVFLCHIVIVGLFGSEEKQGS